MKIMNVKDGKQDLTAATTLVVADLKDSDANSTTVTKDSTEAISETDAVNGYVLITDKERVQNQQNGVQN